MTEIEKTDRLHAFTLYRDPNSDGWKIEAQREIVTRAGDRVVGRERGQFAPLDATDQRAVAVIGEIERFADAVKPGAKE
jgi:hypothetical protein